jgi:purine nucleoside phosphorylase
MDYVGWFTEHVSEDDPDFNAKHPYRATLQLPGWVVTTQGPWFETEADCDDFIRTEIVGMGLLPPRC